LKHVSVLWIFTEMRQRQSLSVHIAAAVVRVALLQWGLCLQYVDTEVPLKPVVHLNAI
jgi:hypothetical protein